MQPPPRVIESSTILLGDDEVVIAHGGRRYRLRATRDGRLAMPGASPALRRLGYLSALAPVLLAAYLARLPIAAMLSEAFLPASEPVFEILFLPALFIYEHCETYEAYCDWFFECMQQIGLLN